MTPKKLVVCGGNGFLGSRICCAAVTRNWDVVSISRSGEPSWPNVSSHQTAPQWSKKVTWRSANILQPETYRQDLQDATAVVHSMGILLEADYKGVLSVKESPISGLQRAFAAKKEDATSRPLEGSVRTGGELTYELMNRDSAVLLAKEANEANVPVFGFVSAAAGAPVLPARYITTKREAEATIHARFPRMRGVFIRPGFLYDSSRSFTMPLAALTYGGFLANSLVGGGLSSLMGSAGAKPLKADVVADAMVEALSDGSVQGPVEIKQIESLANRVWRREML
ncbi:NAD(P)-binding protein [Piedraia hortae CBS 480.64]|uniref:NAD(P)-binding protein n=1 Tax=Piedraia hortae CBS 480.64 TaxID=1314780 RepID=A0A6A7C3X9_9PEZI|nr:NAD(P)-binding protein [Piedraia hortae CBS 480.64]